MASLPSGCLIHFEGESGSLTTFTEVSYRKFLDCREIWLSLDGVQRDIAEKTTQVAMDDCSTFQYLAYHRGCYSKFTNKTLIQRAKDRVTRKQQVSETTEQNNDVEAVPARKVLRSMHPTPAGEAKQKCAHVLPAVCIICNKKTSYFTEQVGTKYLDRNFC